MTAKKRANYLINVLGLLGAIRQASEEAGNDLPLKEEIELAVAKAKDFQQSNKKV